MLQLMRNRNFQSIALLFYTMTLGMTQELPPYTSADPQNLLPLESTHVVSGSEGLSKNIRPWVNVDTSNEFKFNSFLTTRAIYNDNVPNMENTAELWVGKGINHFTTFHIDFYNSYFLLSVEPYFLFAQNKTFESHHVVRDRSVYNPTIVWKYNVLNDGPGRGSGNVNELGLRETQLYVHYEGLGMGLSNAGMWWGPGIHTSLNMSTNTSGFPHLVLGTMREKRWRQFGYQFRYILGELNQNKTKPYLTALLGELTFYNEPTISMGAIRTILSGGTYDPDVSFLHAALVPFQSFFKKSLFESSDEEDPVELYDIDDQTASLYISFLFPREKLKIFLEYGWDDHRWDWYDLRAHPDHSGASIIGLRKSGLFHYQQLFFGFEYANLSKSPFYPHRESPDWYTKKEFFYSTNDGRRYAAHSGSDSDDMLIYLAWVDEIRSIQLSFNYERHGIVYSVQLLDITNAFHFPETKLEFQFNYKQVWGLGELWMYYEFEYTENLGSPAQLIHPHVERPERKANVFGLGYSIDLISQFGN